MNGKPVQTVRDKDGPGGRDPKPRARFRLRGGKHRWFVRAYDYAGNQRTSRAFKRSTGSRKSSVLYVDKAASARHGERAARYSAVGSPNPFSCTSPIGSNTRSVRAPTAPTTGSVTSTSPAWARATTRAARLTLRPK